MTVGWTPLLFLALRDCGFGFYAVCPAYVSILTGIVLGGSKLSQGRALMLSFIYVQGMALTCTLLGLVVASTGMQFKLPCNTLTRINRAEYSVRDVSDVDVRRL